MRKKVKAIVKETENFIDSVFLRIVMPHISWEKVHLSIDDVDLEFGTAATAKLISDLKLLHNATGMKISLYAFEPGEISKGLMKEIENERAWIALGYHGMDVNCTPNFSSYQRFCQTICGWNIRRPSALRLHQFMADDMLLNLIGGGV